MLFQENIFWLRVFSSDDIIVSELAAPFEKSVEYEWNSQTNGGARYITNNKKTTENANWPINPQYLLKFDSSIFMKIIVRKTTGHFANEETKVGMMLTKPSLNEDSLPNNKVVKIKKKVNVNTNKTDQILRVLESTEKILETKQLNYDKILRKLSYNQNEWVVESSYNSNYTSSLFLYLNKIDSPITVIPTLQESGAKHNFKLFIYSNKPIELFSLNNEVIIYNIYLVITL